MIKYIFIFLLIPSTCFGWGPLQAFNSGIDCQYDLDSYTSSLIHFNEGSGTTFSDDVGGNTFTVYADGTGAYGVSSPSKFGNGSVYFNGGIGSGTSVYSADSEDFNLSEVSKWTVDFWYRPESPVVPSSRIYFFSQGDKVAESVGYIELTYEASLKSLAFSYRGYYDIDLEIIAPASFTPQNWYHISVARGWSGVTTSYVVTVNGESKGSTSHSSGLTNFTTPFMVGLYDRSNSVGEKNNPLNGYIDEFRISKDIARWTENFGNDLPTKPYCD